MKTLSVKQPWAWLICSGHKDIENRSWPAKLRGKVYIHAGLRPDNKAWDFVRATVSPSLWSRMQTKEFKAGLVRGSIIGEAEIVDCVQASSSPWFVGRYGFVLRNAKLYKTPVPCKGRLRFFEVTLPRAPS
jgi:hypothetical protein